MSFFAVLLHVKADTSTVAGLAVSLLSPVAVGRLTFQINTVQARAITHNVTLV